MVGLHVLLVAASVSGLRLAGLGIDVLRFHFDPSGSAPKWPLGIVPPSGWTPMQSLVAISIAILMVALVVAGLKIAAAFASAGLSQRVLLGLRTGVYDKLHRLSFRFFDNAESSSLINRAAGDVQAVRMFSVSVEINRSPSLALCRY